MKCSQYNYLYDAGDSYALWNTLSGELRLLDESVYSAMCNGDISLLGRDTIRELCNIGALIDDNTDELKSYIDGCSQKNKVAPWYYRILTTTDCNAQCYYCYEKGAGKSSMTAETAEKVAGFIINNYRSLPMRTMIHWFGGEPLLNPGPISQICEILSNSGIPFISTITTNGLLITEELLNAASKKWHLKSVQITMDGLGSDYERIKSVPNGSFDILCNNISTLLDMSIHIKLRINECGDVEGEARLIHKIKELYGENELLSVYVSPLYQAGEYVERESMERVLNLEQELFHTGLADEKQFYTFYPRYTRCFSCSDRGYTIYPNGSLYNCSHCIKKEESFGSVEFPKGNMGCRKKYIQPKLSKKCRECMFLPLCAGGCRTAELGLASVTQCFYYRSVMDKLFSIRLKYSDKIIVNKRSEKGDKSMETLTTARMLTPSEQEAFAKVLFADIFPEVQKEFASATNISYDANHFMAAAKSGGTQYSAICDVSSVNEVEKLTASYSYQYDTWGSLDTWSGENTTRKEAVVYTCNGSAVAYFDGEYGWDSYDGIFSNAVKIIGQSSAEAHQVIKDHTMIIIFKDPLKLHGWFGISFEEYKTEDRNDWDSPYTDYKKWVIKAKPKVSRPAESFCTKCGLKLENWMMFCPKCGTKSGNSYKPLDLSGWPCGQAFLTEVANEVFSSDEQPYMGEYSGLENQLAAVTQMLELISEYAKNIVRGWGDSSDGLTASKGKIVLSDTESDSCDGCYDGGCGGPCYYTLQSFVEKITPEEYEKERASAVAAGIGINTNDDSETFTLSQDTYDTYRRTEYMKNAHNLHGYYRCHVEHDQ